MNRQHALSARAPRTRRWVFPAVLLAVSLICLLAGLASLWQHYRGLDHRAYRASAGLLLALLGLAQARVAVAAWRRHSKGEFGRPPRMLFWRWLLAGPVACYLAALLVGPDPGTAYFYLAALGCWYTAALAPLVLDRRWCDKCEAVLLSDPLARCGRFAFLLLAVSALGETSVRLYALLTGDHLPVVQAVRSRTLPPGGQFQGRVVNSQGYWDDAFETAARPGVFRIAALGDGAVLSGTAQSNYLARIERSVPGIEIYNFGIPGAGPREYAVQLAQEVIAYKPDMVLTFISVGDDVTDELPLPGVFDWKSLGVYQLGARCLGTPHGIIAQPSCGHPAVDCLADREVYLQAACSRLAVCRTPIDQRMCGRWNETLAHLKAIVDTCERSKIAAALVLVPAEFQVSRPLCESLCRRAGYDQGQLDLDLPQRRLAAFADEHQVPVLDLLPHFRASRSAGYRRNERTWTDAGHDLAVEAVGQWLQRRYATQVAAASSPAP